ncbi:MAG: DUF6588 family protein [Candidatus Eisenbacteria bacterium]
MNSRTRIKNRPGPWSLVFLGLAALIPVQPVAAQLEENVVGLSDENLEGYLEPLQTGLSSTMNAAVFRTGHVPRQGLTFSIGVAAMAIGYDDEDRGYVPTDPPGFTSEEPTTVPTVVGDPEGAIVMGEGGLSQIYPGGFDMDGFEIAVPQVSLGAVLGTRVIARYIALDLGDSDLGDFSYFGIGGQHSITQWIPSLPVDLAAGVFAQSFKIGEDVVKASALHLNLTASRQYGILQPYAGFGYDSMSLEVKSEDEEDPEFSIDAKLDKESNTHLTLGLMAKLPVISAFFEYNSSAAAGFALGLEFGM